MIDSEICHFPRRWDESVFERKMLVDSDYSGTHPFSVLRLSEYFTGAGPETFPACTNMFYDARLSSTVLTDNPSFGEDMSQYVGLGVDETFWGNAWSDFFYSTGGINAIQPVGPGLFPGLWPSNTVGAGRSFWVQDREWYAKESGDGCFLSHIRYHLPTGGPCDMRWRFMWMMYQPYPPAPPWGYYMVNINLTAATGPTLDVYVMDSLGVLNLLGFAALPGYPANMDEWVLCVIDQNQTFTIYYYPAGAGYPYVGVGGVTIGPYNKAALPANQQWYHGTHGWWGMDPAVGPNNQCISFPATNTYGRLYDNDNVATGSKLRFNWKPMSASPYIGWSLQETLNWQSISRTCDLVGGNIETHCEVRAKNGNTSWNVSIGPTLTGMWRNIIITNTDAVAVLKAPPIAFANTPMTIDATESFANVEFAVAGEGLIAKIDPGDGGYKSELITSGSSLLRRHTYATVSNPIDGGTGYDIELCVGVFGGTAPQQACQFGIPAVKKIWIAPAKCDEMFDLDPQIPFETVEETRPNSGVGRHNAPYLSQDVIQNTYAGDRQWNITGRHMANKILGLGKTDSELQDIALYEHYLFDVIQRYGVVVRVNIQGDEVLGIIESYNAQYHPNTKYIKYDMTFSEINRPWQAVTRTGMKL